MKKPIRYDDLSNDDRDLVDKVAVFLVNVASYEERRKGKTLDVLSHFSEFGAELRVSEHALTLLMSEAKGFNKSKFEEIARALPDIRNEEDPPIGASDKEVERFYQQSTGRWLQVHSKTIKALRDLLLEARSTLTVAEQRELEPFFRSNGILRGGYELN